MLIEFEQIHESSNINEKICIDTDKIVSIATFSEEPCGEEEFYVGFLLNNSIRVPYVYYRGVLCMADVDTVTVRKKEAQAKLFNKLQEIKQYF